MILEFRAELDEDAVPGQLLVLVEHLIPDLLVGTSLQDVRWAACEVIARVSTQHRDGVGAGACCCFFVADDQSACSIQLGITLHMTHDDILAQLKDVLGVGS